MSGSYFASNRMVKVSESKDFTVQQMAAYIKRYEFKGWIVQADILFTVNASHPQIYKYNICRVSGFTNVDMRTVA